MIAISIAITVLLLLSSAEAAPVVLFGDWYCHVGDLPLVNVLIANGHTNFTTSQWCYGWITADIWARNPEYLLNAVAANPDATHLWLSTGLFDAAVGLLLGRDLDHVADVLFDSMIAIIEPVWERYPNLKTVSFGYEIFTWEMAVWPGCTGFADFLFRKQCGRRGEIDIECINEVTYELQILSDRLAAANPRQHTSVDIRGAVQRGSNGTIPQPYPNMAFGSPEDLMRDCVTPLFPYGFTYLMEDFYEKYWSIDFPPRNNVTAVNAPLIA